MARKNNASDRLGVMPVNKLVFSISLPVIISMLVQAMYNIVDSAFVGSYGDMSLRALSLAFPVQNLFIACAVGFGVGTNALVARYLGKRNRQKASSIANTGIMLSILGYLVFLILSFFICEPFFAFQTEFREVVNYGVEYLSIVMIGSIAIFMEIILERLLMATGKTKLSMVSQASGAIINIVLDPLFVLPQFIGLGAVGAGMATALSNVLATVFFLISLYRMRKNSVIHIDPKYLRYAKLHLKSILSVGFPSAVQYALTVVAIAAQAKFVSKYATEAVAALGIVKKLDQLPLYFSIGVSSGLLPLLAYNYASGNQTRRRKSFRFGCMISLSFSLLCLVCYELFAPQLSALFIEDATTISYSAGFLRRMVTAMPMMSLCYPMIIQFQAMGKVKESLITSVLRKGVLDIPLLFLMDRLMPLYGCMWVQPIVDSISLIVAGTLYFRLKHNESMT